MDANMSKTAKPQIIRPGMNEIWPERWGITVAQFASLLEECQQSDHWSDDFSVADLVSKYVIKKTRGTGLSYAVLINASEPKEVDVMISHAWQENALDFCRTLERSVDSNEGLFICALSLYQCEDGYGPSIAEQLGIHPQESPFHRVLQKIHDTGEAVANSGGWWRQRTLLTRVPWVLLFISLTCTFTPVIVKGCIPMHNTCAHGTCKPLFKYLPIYVWEWTFEPLDSYMYAFVCVGHILGVVTMVAFMVLEILEWTGHIFKGRMVAVPNHNCEMYTRKWCVFEMFVAQSLLVPVKLANTLASAGEVDSAHAECSKVEDAKKIDDEIQSYKSGEEESDDKEAGYRMLDDAIHEVSSKAWRRALFILALQIFPLALCLMCTVRTIQKGSVEWWKDKAEKRRDTEWSHHVLYLATHGRLGYDLFCPEVFEASPEAVWSWLLIYGILLGYWVVLCSVVYVAKKAQGHLSFKHMAIVAFGLFIIEVLLNVFIIFAEHLLRVCDYDPYILYRLNWFVIGLTASISQGSLVLLLVILVTAIRYVVLGPPALLGKNAEAAVIAYSGLAGVIAFLVIMFYTCRVHHPEHWFPSFVVNFALIFGWLLGPLSILLANAIRFGVRFKPRTSIGRASCRCSNSRRFDGLEYCEVSDGSSGSDEEFFASHSSTA